MNIHLLIHHQLLSIRINMLYIHSLLILLIMNNLLVSNCKMNNQYNSTSYLLQQLYPLTAI
jgi:hypothetical protein